MNSVEFEEENFLKKPRGSKPSSMVRLLMNSGLVNNERQASILLVVFIIVAFSVTVFVLVGRNAQQTAYVIDDEGNRYEIGEYIQLVKQGRDPLKK